MTYTSRVRQSHALSETESGLVESLLETLHGNNENDEYAMDQVSAEGQPEKKMPGFLKPKNFGLVEETNNKKGAKQSKRIRIFNYTCI